MAVMLITCICLVTMYATHIPYSEQSPLSFHEDASSFEDRVVISERRHSKIKTSRKSEAKRQSFCMNTTRIDRHYVTSTLFSKIQLVALDKTAGAVVQIVTFNTNNMSKHEGGDVISIWANQAKGDGLVSGSVIDNGDGSYTGIIRTYWLGISSIHVKLMSSIEQTCLRYRALQKYGTVAYTAKQPNGIRASFITNSEREMTECNTNNFIYGNNKICNFTTMNGGMSWFCGHPKSKHLQCRDLNSFSNGRFITHTASPTDIIQGPWYGMFKTRMSVNITVESTANKRIYCKIRNPIKSWTESMPTGFWMRGTWRMTNCYSSLNHTAPEYRQCLKNKTLIMLGDSTVREYADYFLNDVLNLHTTITSYTFGPNGTYHKHTNFVNYGINVIYRKQAMPLYSPASRVPINGILSFPQILDTMTRNNITGSSMIVLVHYYAHFLAYPPARYRERLRSLVASIKRLLEVKPLTKVFVKGSHVSVNYDVMHDPHIGLRFNEILEEEFEDIMDKVIYLNTYDISVAHNNENLHPKGNAFRSQIQQFMSYIC